MAPSGSVEANLVPRVFSTFNMVAVENREDPENEVCVKADLLEDDLKQ